MIHSRDAGGLAMATALVAAVVITTLDGGGFSASAQAAFVVLAGVVLLAAACVDPRRFAVAARSPLALALLALAVLSLASADWTVAERGAAVRSGLVIGGYAAVLLGAAALAPRTGIRPFAYAVAALALAEGVLGLHAVALHALPDAERIDGVWRAGGTYQYPPALAIAQVAALPVIGSLLTHRSVLLAGAAAGAAVLCGAVLACCASRLGMTLAGVVLLVPIIWPAVGAGGRAGPVAGACCVLVGASIGSALLGGHSGPRTPGAGWPAIAAVFGTAAGCGVLWLVMRRAAPARAIAVLALAATTCVLGVAGASSSRATEPPRPSGVREAGRAQNHADFLHGRGHELQTALETWADHKLFGAGAGAYYQASLPHQQPSPSLYAHDLPLELAAELGILGALLAIALYASATHVILRARLSPDAWLLAPASAAFLVSNLFDWTWHLAGLTATWAAATGALLAVSAHVTRGRADSASASQGRDIEALSRRVA